VTFIILINPLNRSSL